MVCFSINDTICTPFSDSQCLALVYCKRVSAGLSVVGVIFTLWVIFFFRTYKEFTQRLIFHLSVASMFDAVGYFVDDFERSDVDPDARCVFQGAFLTYSLWTVQMFVFGVMMNMYSSVTFGKDLEKYEKVLVAICWILPLLFAGLPFINNHYGPAGVWCWMKGEWQWRFGIWYIWNILFVIVFFLVMLHMVIVIKQSLKESGDSANSAHAQNDDVYEDIRNLRKYPFVFAIVCIFPIINRIQNAINPCFVYALLMLQTLSGPFLGAGIAVAFILDKRTTRLLTVDNIKKTYRERRAGKLKPSNRPVSNTDSTSSITAKEHTPALTSHTEVSQATSF